MFLIYKWFIIYKETGVLTVKLPVVVEGYDGNGDGDETDLPCSDDSDEASDDSCYPTCSDSGRNSQKFELQHSYVHDNSRIRSWDNKKVLFE